ncbi:hypothetical protein F8M41_002780 [Gigaspora margarita]|uniref:Uncharacterized protein n=1 Tax=Gigaspora margarita TaxID=4874 RepID=A0A8H4A722_GIGMA|nr:hypothetical protein F8M41_002780 [Gigaspora margarita]
MADEAMITAIAESIFAESKSSHPSFLYPWNHGNGGNGRTGALLEELFGNSNTVTADSTPDVDDMDAYFNESSTSQHHFQNLHFCR